MHSLTNLRPARKAVVCSVLPSHKTLFDLPSRTNMPPNERPSVDFNQITFGIELETMCSLLLAPRHRALASDDCVRETALEEIRHHGLKAQLVDADPNSHADDSCSDSSDADGPDYSVWGIAHESTVTSDVRVVRHQYPELPALRASAARTCWCPATRSTVCHAGIEFVSPIFRLADRARWAREIGAALAALYEGRLRAAVPESAGYHVHVGLGSERFALEQVKKIAAVAILGEETIDQFHAAHRRNEGNMVQAIIRRAVFAGKTRAEIFDMVMATKTLEEFKKLVCADHAGMAYSRNIFNSRYYKVNFTNVDVDDYKGTIEFRQHAGTLDSVEIMMWIQFVGLMVHSACRYSTRELQIILVVADESSAFRMNPRKFLSFFIRNKAAQKYYLDKIGAKLDTPNNISRAKRDHQSDEDEINANLDTPKRAKRDLETDKDKTDAKPDTPKRPRTNCESDNDEINSKPDTPKQLKADCELKKDEINATPYAPKIQAKRDRETNEDEIDTKLDISKFITQTKRDHKVDETEKTDSVEPNCKRTKFC